MPHILIADDEDSLRWVLEKGLRQAGYEVTAVRDGAAAVRAVEAEPFDLVFLDVRMPGVDGLAALARMREVRADACVVVMTAHGTMETAIQAMQRGAYDYLTKPFDLDELLLLAERALAAGRLTQEVARLKTGLQEVREFSALIGRHPRMQEVYKTIGRIAGTDVTVLLRGESGTGKELVARAIHHYSRRAGRPFVAVSCAAIPGTLLESEMFGHERGAFTDAKERRLGKFELAHGGTLYLDEIGDMPLELQAKLLRALQERTIERLGGHESIRVDVRVLAATNRDLEAFMREGKFREDLYYRLNVVTLHLPPLRERRRDIPLLVEHFLAKHVSDLGERGVAPDALDRLVGHDWPGNVRELENVVQRAMVMADERRDPARAPADRAGVGRRLRRRRCLAGGDHRAQAHRVRARPARARQRQPLRPDDRSRREAAAPRRPPRDGRQPGPGRPDPRHQPQHAPQEAHRARDRSRHARGLSGSIAGARATSARSPRNTCVTTLSRNRARTRSRIEQRRSREVHEVDGATFRAAGSGSSSVRRRRCAASWDTSVTSRRSASSWMGSSGSSTGATIRPASPCSTAARSTCGARPAG